jgi:hippurate hydrolase
MKGPVDFSRARQTQWKSWRHHIHAHPELAFAEVGTAEFIAEKLTAFGLEVTRGLAGTGVVATLAGRDRSRAIAFRADMDALPIEEENRFAHRSRMAGRMHACGHDGHVVMLLAAAEQLAGQTPEGDIHFIFQPAEEGAGGAAAMILDGLFDRFPAEAVFAIHNHPGIALGQFGVVTGPVMAAYDEFTIQIRGRGGHAAMPHQADDVVLAAASFIVAAQTIVSRNLDPMHSGVVSVTMVRAGEARNALPSTAHLEGSFRSFTAQDRARIDERIRGIADGIAATFGVEIVADFAPSYPPTVNHPAESEKARHAVRSAFGESALATVSAQPASEDFAFMLERTPGCYVLLGSGDPRHRKPVHNPLYDFNDAASPYGVGFWIALAETYFASTRDSTGSA